MKNFKQWFDALLQGDQNALLRAYLQQIPFEGNERAELHKAISNRAKQHDENDPYTLFLNGLVLLKGWNLTDEEYKGQFFYLQALSEFTDEGQVDAFMNACGMANSPHYVAIKAQWPKVVAESITHLEKAIQSNNSHAMNLRGWMHEIGLGGPVDYAKAKELYEKSIKSNLNYNYSYIVFLAGFECN